VTAIFPFRQSTFPYLSRQPKSRRLVFLELTPPAYSTSVPHATAQTFVALHGLLSICTAKERWLHRCSSAALEYVSTREAGVRYIISLDPGKVSLFKQLVRAHLPTSQCREVADYLPATSPGAAVVEFRHAKRVSYVASEIPDTYDPIAYMASAMARPDPGEILALQFVITPAAQRHAGRAKHAPTSNISRGLLRMFGMCVRGIVAILRALLELIGDEVSGVRTPRTIPQPPDKAPSHLKPVPLQTMAPELPQFSVTIRALAVGNPVHLQGIANALKQFHAAGYQGFTAKHVQSSDGFRQRALAKGTILQASDVALLYHFPREENMPAENVVHAHAKELPAPVAMKRRVDGHAYSIALGLNTYHGLGTVLSLTEQEREKHAYIVGGTGSGKTTLLSSTLLQDITAGRGVAFIDPHGDAAEMLLEHIPKERLNDVIYFNPSDISYPIGLNILEQPKGLGEDELLLERDFITESIVSIFRKIFSDDDSGGHRIEHFLRNAIHTAFVVPDATLFTVYKLLTNAAFRNLVLSKLTDQALIDFWNGEFNRAGDYQKVKMSSGVNAKLGRFQRSVVTRRILEQPHSTIDFDDIIQSGKILICNFSKGKIGEDTSTLLGISVLTKLQLAALRRSRMRQAERRSFYLYVDEFQNFATTSFVQLLSEARKYKLYLTMAEQSTAQQSERRLTEAILANVGTVICFRTGSTIDEQLLLPWFEPYIRPGEIGNLPLHTYYLRVRAGESMEPMSGETVPILEEGDEKIKRQIIQTSRTLYGNARQ